MSRFWNTLAIAAACSSILGLLIGLRAWSSGVLGAAIPRAAIFSEGSARTSEEIAFQNYRQAAEVAQQAVVAFEAAANTDSSALKLNFMLQERSHWQSALEKLKAVPASSALNARSRAKQTQYQRLLTTVENKLIKANEDFLIGAVQDADIDPSGVHITLCQIENPRIDHLSVQASANPAEVDPAKVDPAKADKADAEQKNRLTDNRLLKRLPKAVMPPEGLAIEPSVSPTPPTRRPTSLLQKGQVDPNFCRHHQGEQLMASPASLIKVPVAVALADRAHRKPSMTLDQKILIDAGNFTENAAGSVIEVGQAYSLRKVMSRMIIDSDNIATNQLIDYLGYDQIERSLKQLGYSQTLVGHKLAGDQVIPTDFGPGNNQSSTHEITTMMAQFYSVDTPANRDITTALRDQSDRELGYEALTDIPSPVSSAASASPSTNQPAALKIQWLGEKTGQNAEVLASTLAMSVGQNYYVLTVALDNNGNADGLRQIIRGIADHLSKAGPLIQ
jgi:beta-lactamase class A